MTPIETAENTPSHVSAARAADVPSTTQSAAVRTLDDAIRAVIEHRREVEMRRMALAAQQRGAPSDDWLVPVPRSRLLALEKQARQAEALLGLLNRGTMAPAGTTTAQPPHERHRPPKPNQRPRVEARPSSPA